MTLVDDYGVGAELVDDEHKALIDRINRLDDQLMVENGPLATSTFFEDLTETITVHFIREERFMCERGYDQLPQRKDSELEELYSLVDEFDRNEKASREELAARLDGWFSDYFENHDVRLADVFGSYPSRAHE